MEPAICFSTDVAPSLAALVDIALEEDGASRDITSTLALDVSAKGRAVLRTREPCTVSGVELIALLAQRVEGVRGWTGGALDGTRVEAGATIGGIEGSLRSILGIERVLLNLLGLACATATVTRSYVDAIDGTRARIFDTRKTLPGLRMLQKYAVHCGGGGTHRLGLHDAVLLKDNHLAGLSPSAISAKVAAVSTRARSRPPFALQPRFVCCEVDTLAQLDALLQLPAGVLDIALVDNFSLEQLREAVARRDALQPTLLLEASGGVRMETVRVIAQTGVDRISVGALTHSVRWTDVGLDMSLDMDVGMDAV
ncbi:MAG: carboxylating nicotinate-nucleotide diphosphorylase [Phycisphaerales bacterium]|nr:carboxylating nicotinate-nucleotide diphosphorylase [Phycisphaerales bacterium]